MFHNLLTHIPKFRDNTPDFRDTFYLHTVVLKQRLLELSPPVSL